MLTPDEEVMLRVIGARMDRAGLHAPWIAAVQQAARTSNLVLTMMREWWLCQDTPSLRFDVERAITKALGDEPVDAAAPALPIHVRLRARDIVGRAIEEAATLAWQRAHQHQEQPDETVMCRVFGETAMGKLGEILRLDDE